MAGFGSGDERTTFAVAPVVRKSAHATYFCPPLMPKSGVAPGSGLSAARLPLHNRSVNSFRMRLYSSIQFVRLCKNYQIQSRLYW